MLASDRCVILAESRLSSEMRSHILLQLEVFIAVAHAKHVTVAGFLLWTAGKKEQY